MALHNLNDVYMSFLWVLSSLIEHCLNNGTLRVKMVVSGIHWMKSEGGNYMGNLD